MRGVCVQRLASFRVVASRAGYVCGDLRGHVLSGVSWGMCVESCKLPCCRESRGECVWGLARSRIVGSRAGVVCGDLQASVLSRAICLLDDQHSIAS